MRSAIHAITVCLAFGCGIVVVDRLSLAQGDPSTSEVKQPEEAARPKAAARPGAAAGSSATARPGAAERTSTEDPVTRGELEQQGFSPASRGVLPSEDKRKPGDPVPPAEILRDYELTPERIKEAVGDVALWQDEGNAEILLNLLYRFRRISDLNIELTATPDDQLSQLVRSPDSYLLKTFSLHGRVVMVEQIDVSAKYSDRFEMQRLYRCDLLVGDEELPAVVYSLQVPKAWTLGEPIDENVSCYGLFVHRGSGEVGVAPLVFVTKQVAWHSASLLGDLGMDIGMLDNVVQKQPLLPQEQECFYRMLQAAKVAGAAEMFRLARQDVIFEGRKLVEKRKQIEQRLKQLTAGVSQPDITEIQKLEREKKLLQLRIDHIIAKRSHEFFPLLRKPQEHVGDLKMYRGTARRIVPVLIEKPELVKRYGIRKYYQMDMLVKLEGRLKVLKPSSEGAPGEEKVDRVGWTHPATVCFLELPEGMPTGDNIVEDVRIAGFFLKHWTFFDDEDEKGDLHGRSAAMFIARKPIWEQRPSTGSNAYLSTLAGGLFVVAVVGIWFGVWRMNCGDRRFQDAVVTKLRTSTDEVSLEDLDFNFDSGTEFGEISSDEKRD